MEVDLSKENAQMERPARSQAEIVELAHRMYEETFRRMEDARLRDVVESRITAMYGPPMRNPELMLVSFQGGAGDASPSEPIWPDRLRYLDSRFDFGRALRRQFGEAGLSETLEDRTVAMAACFPEAPAKESSRWMAKHGARADWREFSSTWVRRMVSAMCPRAVLLFGKKASEALGLEGHWRDEVFDARGWRAFGRAELKGCPAIYCQHLSQGWSRKSVQASLRTVRRIIEAPGEGSRMP